MIERLYKYTFLVKRQELVTTVIDDKVIKKSEEVEIGTFRGYIQQADAEFIQNFAITYTKPHIVWCSLNTDVRDGDILISDNFGTFAVRGKQINRDGRNNHLQLTVEWYGDPVESIS
jgi:hypothetical protein